MDVLARPVVSTVVTAQPGSPTSGDMYVIPAGKTGTQWATFATGSLAYYLDGTWYEYTPYEGQRVYSSASNSFWLYDSTWSELPLTSAGRHAIPIMAGAMTPSVAGGCATLASVASAANQPDITYLAFDPTTQEFA